VVERECPFCASVLATVAAPSRLTVALLGLCLAACSTSKEPPPSKGGDKSPKEEQPSDVTPTPEPAPEPAEPEPEPAEPEPAQPELGEPDPVATTGAAPEENGNVGTNDGSTADPPKPPPEPVPKYGGPRPKKKYGAPPPMPDEPF
jgi:hypothetical protein